MNMDVGPSFFTVMATGQIESADIPGCDTAYCKFELVAGEDWKLLDGAEACITQVARRSLGPDRRLVWNFPIDAAYGATNAFGWPQLVVSVYGLDAWGRDVVKGYGAAHLPTAAGRHALRLRLFKPRSASPLRALVGWLTGAPAEFADPRFPAYGQGREVTRVVSGGCVDVVVDVLTKDMGAFGYADGSGGVSGSRDQQQRVKCY